MKTNDNVIKNVNNWLQANEKSQQWLADQLNVSKALVGHMLTGRRTILPKRIEDLSKVLDIPIQELIKDNSVQRERLTIQLRGNTTNRRSKQAVEALLFAVDDYVGLKQG